MAAKPAALANPADDDIAFNLEFEVLYHAEAVDALAHLVANSRDLGSAEGLGSVLKVFAHHAEHVKAMTMQLLYPARS
jgi:hypothetical protein